MDRPRRNHGKEGAAPRNGQAQQTRHLEAEGRQEAKAPLRATAWPVVFLLAGCTSTLGPVLTERIATEALPAASDGAVAVRARAVLSVTSFTEAARRLVDWEHLTWSQRSTEAFVPLAETEDLRQALPKLFPEKRSGRLRKKAQRAFHRWREADRKAFAEVFGLLGELGRWNSPGANLAQAFCAGAPPETARSAALRFQTERGPVVVLAEAACEQTQKEAVLLEIHYFVSSSYRAGVNVYCLKQQSRRTAELTCELLCWIPEAEGFFGALLPRQIATSHLLGQTEKTYQEVAAYLVRPR